MDPKERMRAALKAARDIAEKAQGEKRDMTAEEVGEVASHLKSYEAAKKDFATAKSSTWGVSDEDRERLKAIGLPLEDGTHDRKTWLDAPSKAWGAKVGERIREALGPGATKAFPGTIAVPSIIQQEPVLIDGEPTRILDLIPRRPNQAANVFGPGVGNTFSWLKQTVRNLDAGGTPDNAQKRKSNIEFAEVEDRFRVYATITDPMPKRYLDDFAQLVQVLRTQLGEGLQEALEVDVVHGSGTPTPEVVSGGVVTTQGDDPVRGILNTSGIQVQAFSSSALDTLSAARYKLTDSHETPNAWLMNSADVRAFEMLRETGTGAFMFGSGRSTLRQVLGDYPIVISSLIDVGSAVLGDFTKTELVIREDDHIDTDSSGTLFDRNQVKFRNEGRYGFAVNRPHAFITVDLTA